MRIVERRSSASLSLTFNFVNAQVKRNQNVARKSIILRVFLQNSFLFGLTINRTRISKINHELPRTRKKKREEIRLFDLI